MGAYKRKYFQMAHMCLNALQEENKLFSFRGNEGRLAFYERKEGQN